MEIQGQPDRFFPMRGDSRELWKPGFANVVATVALFIAWAAFRTRPFQIPKGSVGTKN